MNSMGMIDFISRDIKHKKVISVLGNRNSKKKKKKL